MMPVIAALWSVTALISVPLLVLAARQWSAATASSTGRAFLLFVSPYSRSLSPISWPATVLHPRFGYPLDCHGSGAHFRIDFLSAFFLVIVNLGGAAASLYALGYGEA